jgi:hypothetical protein
MLPCWVFDRTVLRLARVAITTALVVSLVIAVPITVAIFGLRIPGGMVVDFLAWWFR